MFQDKTSALKFLQDFLDDDEAQAAELGVKGLHGSESTLGGIMPTQREPPPKDLESTPAPPRTPQVPMTMLGGPRPRPEPAGPDSGLLEAQSQDKQDAGIARMRLGFTQLANAFTPRADMRADTSMLERQSVGGDAAVQAYRERRASEEEREKKRKATELEALMEDPSSKESQAALAVLGMANPEVAARLRGQGLSAKQMQAYAPWIKEILGNLSEEQKARIAAGAKQKELEAKRTENKEKRDGLVKALQGDPRYEPIFKAFADDIGNVSYDVLLEEKNKIDSETQADKANQAHKDAAGIAAGAAAEKEKQKNERERQTGMPQGYEATGDMTTAQKQALSEGLFASNSMRGTLSRLSADVKNSNWAERLAGPQTRNAIQEKVEQLRLEAKEVAKLGALAGPDYSIISKIVNDPTQWAKVFFDDPERNLAEVEAWIANRVAAAEKTFPIRRTAAASEGRETPPKSLDTPPKPSPGPEWKRGKVDGKPGWINPQTYEFEAD